MAASTIIGALQLTGMASAGFLGSKYGNKMKLACFNTFPSIKSSYESRMPKFKNKHLSEENMFNMIGCLGGIAVGYYVWPVTIPVTIVYLSQEYSQEIDRAKKYFKPK